MFQILRLISFILVLLLNFSKSWALQVLIDPGHGGRDRGAAVENAVESEVVWPWALALKRELTRNGVLVKLSRSENQVPSPQARRELLASSDFDLIVSLHANFFHDPSTKGIEYFVSSALGLEDQKLKLAYAEKKATILDTVINDLKTQGLRRLSLQLAKILQKTWTGKIQQGSFEVLEISQAPTVLIELGYLSNVLDRKALQDPQYIQFQSQKLAQSIKQSLFDLKGPVF